MKYLKKVGIVCLIAGMSASSMAVAGYTLGQEVPSNGNQNVSTAPSLTCTESISWTSSDAPIYNGYTVLQGLPMGTTPTLIQHQFQTSYPQSLQASIQDFYSFSPLIPAGTNMGVTFTFVPAAGQSVSHTSNFRTK